MSDSEILRLKCTKFYFCRDSAPDPAGDAYSTPPEPQSVFKGPTSKGTEGEGRGRGEKRKGRVEEGSVPPVGETGSASASCCSR